MSPTPSPGPQGPVPSSRTRPLLLVLSLAFVTAGALLLSPELGDLGGDSAQYLMLADALASGQGYVDLHLPEAPAHGHYPPGLALLLLPWVATLGPEAFVRIKLFLLALALGALLAWFRLLRRRSDDVRALIALSLCALSGNLLVAAVRVQSELPYMLVAALALWAMEDGRGRHGAAGGLAGAAGFLLRIAGVTLVATAIVTALRSRSRRALVGAGLGSAVALVWFAYSSSVATGTWGYGDELLHSAGGVRGLPGHVLAGLALQGQQLGRLLGDSPWTSASTALQLTLTGLVLVGLALRLRSGLRPAELWWLLSFGMAAVAPRPLERYLLPLLPLSALYLVEGVAGVCAGLGAAVARVRRNLEGPRGSTGLARGAAVVLPVVLALLHVQATVGLVELRRRPAVSAPPPLAGPGVEPVDMAEWEEGWLFGDPLRVAAIRRAYADFLMLSRSCRDRLPPGAVLAARKPRVVAFLAGRPCVPLPAADDPDPAARLRRAGVTHVLADALFADTRSFIRAAGDRVGLVPGYSVRSSVLFSLPADRGRRTEAPSPRTPR